MFWSFEMTRLLARDRISQMRREVERDRLVRQAAALAASPGGQPRDGQAEDAPRLPLRARQIRGSERAPALPAFPRALSPAACCAAAHAPANPAESER